MFQLIGSLLAFFAIISVIADARLAGAVFALLTFIWVVVAKLRPSLGCRQGPGSLGLPSIRHPSAADATSPISIGQKVGSRCCQGRNLIVADLFHAHDIHQA